MKIKLLILILFIIPIKLFAIDLSMIKIGDSKNSVIKQFGPPFKVIKNEKFEYIVWLDNKDIWLASFEDDKIATQPVLLDEFLNSLLELSNAFSDLGDSFSGSNTVNNSKTTKTEAKENVDKSLLNLIDISLLECKIFNKSYSPSAGYRLKVKNNSDKEISKLTIVLYFYDKKGKIFFEDDCILINSEWYSKQKNLKPNYSMLMPDSSSSFFSVDGMDIDEWDEGKVSYEVIELK